MGKTNFYTNYLKQKNTVFSQLKQDVLRQVKRDEKIVTCRKGCANCCCVYIEATTMECEAIAQYLYKRKKILASFLRKYPGWRNATKKFSDRCTENLYLIRNRDKSEKIQRDLADALLFYKLLNVVCPFLIENSCSIYYARPFTCATHFVTSPPEWCNPRDPRSPEVYKGTLAGVAEEFDSADLNFMPVKVYEILRDSRADLSHTKDVPAFKNEEKDSSV